MTSTASMDGAARTTKVEQGHPTLESHRFGETVRAFRLRRGLSLRELALRTGLSAGMLSQIERNVSSPSLKTLTKLRIGLDVPLSALFEDTGDASGSIGSHSIIRRQAARPALDLGEGVLKILLSPATALNLQVMMLSVEPNGGAKDTVVGLPGEKAVVVMKGQLEITVGGETYLVREGDTIQFDAETPHSFINPGHSETQVIWIIGQLPAERHI